MFEIVYSRKVKNDLKLISNYISLDSPINSIKTVNSILKTIDMLEEFPYIWKEIEWNIRELVEKKYKYKIVYKIDVNFVIILSIYKYQNTWK